MKKNIRYFLSIAAIAFLGTAFISKKNTKPNISPINLEQLSAATTGYGMRTHPITQEQKLHTGMDFPAPLGTPVMATADGEVIKVETSAKKYGNRIIIQHANNITSSYAHLQAIHVKEGQKVTQKDQIGTVGNTGQSTAPHLHYEIKIDDEKVDPAIFIKI